ncbi:MAG: S9 family peptidase [Planctomycetota bacterium]
MSRTLRYGFLLVATASASLALAQPQQQTPLIPRDVLYGNPDKAAPEISPDGTRLSFLAPVNGVMNVWVGPLADPGAAKPVTNDTKRGIRRYLWAFNNTHVIYLQDQGGDENWRVYAVDLATKETKDLTPMKGVAARIEEVSPKFPDEILVGLNNRDPQYHDLHRVNLKTGELKLVLENKEYASIQTDDEFHPVLAMKMTPDGGMTVVRFDAKNGVQEFTRIPAEDSLTTGVAGIDKTGKVAYVMDSRGRDTSALKTVDLDTKEEKLVAADAKSDVAGVMLHPTKKTIEAVSFNYERVRWDLVDPAIKPDLDQLKTVSKGDLNVVDRSQDDQHWIVSYLEDTGPVRVYHWDRTTHKATFLFTNRKALEGLALSPMSPVVIKAKDGLDLVSYLTLPAGTAGKDALHPSAPLPMVLLVHGGPWARDAWGFHPTHQLLANRGYAVLSVNYRASTGFGKTFVNGGNHEWAGKMHTDLLDAVDWAVKEKIADAKKVAIMGGSYGGYATLVGVTMTPDRFACGVDIVGPSNIVTLLQTIPPYWAPMVEMWKTRVGDFTTAEGKAFLEKRSPLTYAADIKRPLLIGQGANDPRVKRAESDQIVAAMKAKGIPVTYVLFPDEGHGFARPENNLAFYGVTEVFLAEQLGGRAQPIDGKSFQGSSIQILEGADRIPGMTQALKQ